MKPSRRMTLALLGRCTRLRTPALGGVLWALYLGAGCGAPPVLEQDSADPQPTSELVAQSARVPQATRVDPATAFAGATPLLTITGKNFTPDLRVYIDNVPVPVTKVTSTTQAQVQLPATINTLGKKLLRVENGLTYRGTERDDLFVLNPDPLALTPVDQTLDAPDAKLIAAGDANGDGKPDAFVLSSDGKTLRVYLSSGRAPLIAAPSLPTYSALTNFVLGDINGDGKLDIVGIATTTPFIWLGDGTGKFTFNGGGFGSSRIGGVDSLQGVVALADVNGDGKLDLCYGTRSGEIGYATGKGDGTFTADTLLWRNTAGWPILQLHLVDLNGDAKLDLLAVGGGNAVFPSTGKQGSVWSFLLQTGTTPLVPSYTYTAADVVTAVAVGDYNGDGKVDAAAVIADGRVLAFTGGGDGRFPAVRSLSATATSGLLFTADWNRDGKLDLLISGRSTPIDYPTSLGYFLGGGDGSFGSETRINMPHSAFSAALLADFDQDMKLDVLGLDAATGRVGLGFGRGDGTVLSSPDLSILWRDFVATGDFNGDGVIDMVTASVIATTGSVALGLGDGGFKAGGTLNFDSGPSALATGDFNRDGKLDVVAPNYDSAVVSLLLGNGDGTLANQRTFSVGKSPNAIAVGDVNGDGLLDLVTANSDADNVSVLIGNGTGNFATSKEYPAGKNPVSVVLADFNGDGRLDLVTANADGNNLSYLQGSAAVAGAFNAAKSLAACPGPASLAAVDWNGDGKLDLVSACADSGEVAFLYGKGDGTFNAVKTVATCAFPLDVQLADLSGDGKLDLAVACGTAKRLQFFIQVGELAFSPSPRSYEIGRGYFVGDLSGDRKADVLLTESPLYPLLLLNTSR